MKTRIYRNWNALVSNFDFRLFDSRSGNKLLALLLTTALLAPIFLFGSRHNVSAYSTSAPAKPSAPITPSAPPIPFVAASENRSAGDSNGGALLAVTNSIAAVEDFFAAPLAAPEDLESVKSVSPITNSDDDDSNSNDGNGETFGVTSPSSSTRSVTKADSVSASTNPMPFGQLSVGTDFDYDGDGKADAGRWRSSAAEYKIRNSGNGTFATQTIGTSSSKIAPGDYDGDGKTDFAVFTSTGNWIIKYSSNGTQLTIPHGQGSDTPAVGDYDGDGKSDLAIARNDPYNFGGPTLLWRIRYSSTGTVVDINHGLPNDVIAQGKYDSDGITDLAVFRPSTGYWYIRNSTNPGGTPTSFQWGLSTDIPVPGDFGDSDTRTDAALYRKSTGAWYVKTSASNFTQSTIEYWGNYGDQPVPADYDGDGTTDYAIRRPASGTWHIWKSSGGTEYHTNGLASDLAVEAAYLRPIGFEMYSYDFARVRLSPKNETGGTDYYSRNFFWGRAWSICRAGRDSMPVWASLTTRSSGRRIRRTTRFISTPRAARSRPASASAFRSSSRFTTTGRRLPADIIF